MKKSPHYNDTYAGRVGHHPHHKQVRFPDYFRLRNGSGLCLDAASETMYQNRGAVQAWQCHDRQNQQWRYHHKQLINGGGLCLTASKKNRRHHRRHHHNNGAGVHLRQCQRGNANQHWLYEQNRWVNEDGHCLDLDSGSQQHNGGLIQMWSCHRRQNQRWQVENSRSPVNKWNQHHDKPDHSRQGHWQRATGEVSKHRRATGEVGKHHRRRQGQHNNRQYVTIRSFDQRCLAVLYGQQQHNGGSVLLGDCHADLLNQWHWDKGRLRHRSGQCLDINGSDLRRNGGRVQIWQCNHAPNQQWQISQGRLRNEAGLCLDLDSGGLQQVQIWACHQRQNQQWQLDY